MKALTICQPYAHLITLPLSDPWHKRIENRKWPTPYRGELLIHAGKSREWLDLDPTETFDETYGIRLADMAFGAAVAVADLVACFKAGHRVHYKRAIVPRAVVKRWPWVEFHTHVEGPWCWLLENVRLLREPIAMSGRQGLWDVPAEIEERVRELLGPIL